MRAHAVSMIKQPVNKKKSDQAQPAGNEIVRKIKKWWSDLTPGEKVFVPICAINVLVFGAWRIPALQPVMLKYFCSNPGSKNIYLPMILSTFSHYSAFHLLANMYVLHSFSSGILKIHVAL